MNKKERRFFKASLFVRFMGQTLCYAGDSKGGVPVLILALLSLFFCAVSLLARRYYINL